MRLAPVYRIILTEVVCRFAKTVRFNELPNATQTDIAENVYQSSDYLRREWNIWTWLEYLKDDVTSFDLPVGRGDVEALYRQVEENGGWGISEKNLAALRQTLKHTSDLDPVIVNGQTFFDGGHRLTVYRELGRKTIPVIDISPMLNCDWKKWVAG